MFTSLGPEPGPGLNPSVTWEMSLYSATTLRSPIALKNSLLNVAWIVL